MKQNLKHPLEIAIVPLAAAIVLFEQTLIKVSERRHGGSVAMAADREARRLDRGAFSAPGTPMAKAFRKIMSRLRLLAVPSRNGGRARPGTTWPRRTSIFGGLLFDGWEPRPASDW